MEEMGHNVFKVSIAKFFRTKVACPPAFNAFSNSRFKFVKFACYTQSVCHQKSSAPPQMEGRDIFADITG